MYRGLSTGRLAVGRFIVVLSLLAVFGGIGTWIVSADKEPINVALWMLPSVSAGFLYALFGVRHLYQKANKARGSAGPAARLNPGTLIVGSFLFFGVAIGSASGFYVYDLQTSIRQSRYDAQSSIATLKARSIDRWLAERWLDVQRHSRSVAQFASDPGDPLSREDILLIEVWFAELLASSPEYAAVGLYSPGGEPIARVGEASRPEDPQVLPKGIPLPATLGEKRLLQRRLAADGPLRLDFAVPVTRGAGVAPAAILVVTFDPSRSLLLEITQWPGVSSSSEIVVLQKQGDQAVILAKTPVEGQAAPTSISIPLSKSQVVGVHAVLEPDGTKLGVDYAGRPVLAASHHVSGIDWTVVAKTGVSEALGPIRQRSILVVLLAIGAIAVAGAWSAALWKSERVSLGAAREDFARDLASLTKHYDTMFQSARDIVFLLDEERRILDANAAACSAYGYSRDEFRQLHASDLRSLKEKGKLEGDWASIFTRGRPVETEHLRRNGSPFPVEITGNVFEVEGRHYFQAFIRDISERRHMEGEIARMARVHTALQSATNIMLRSSDERQFYQSMCDVLIEIAGYRLADVALPVSDDAKSVEFVAVAGSDSGYLDSTRITWGDGPRSKGPTGAAIRTGEVQVNQDFQSNAAMAPWREEALRRGLRSSIGLPIYVDDALRGALTIYSTLPDAFNKDEVAFLTQFCANVTYGIKLIRSRHG